MGTVKTIGARQTFLLFAIYQPNTEVMKYSCSCANASPTVSLSARCSSLDKIVSQHHYDY